MTTSLPEKVMSLTFATIMMAPSTCQSPNQAVRVFFSVHSTFTKVVLMIVIPVRMFLGRNSRKSKKDTLPATDDAKLEEWLDGLNEDEENSSDERGWPGLKD